MFRILILVVFLLTSCAHQKPIEDKEVNAYSSLGDVYSQGGQYADAESYYQKAKPFTSNKTEIMFKIADAQVQQNKLDAAIDTYRQLLSLDPNNRDARYRLARAFMMEGELDKALVQYMNIVTKNPKDYKAINGLGVYLDTVKEYKTAQACYKKGLSVAEKDYSLLNNLGVSYALSGQIKDSKKYLIEATKHSELARPRNNLDLIEKYYAEINDPVVRQKELTNLMVLKVVANSPQVTKALDFAKQHCRP